MSKNQSVPYKLLKQFLEKQVTVEVNTGDVYTGTLLEVEENLSVSLGDIKAVSNNGDVAEMKGAYFRGRRIRLIKLPRSAAEYLPDLTRPPMRGRMSFRGGSRGKRGGGGGKRPFSSGRRERY